MRRWLYLYLLVGLSGTAWAQQKPAQPTPPPSSSSEKDASGLSRDTTFPEDDPAQPTPANHAPQNDAAKKRTPSMEPPRSDRVRIEDLGPAAGESSSKDTQ